MRNLPILVFEIGLNHNGSSKTALKLIDCIDDIAGKYNYPYDKVYYKFQKRSPRESTPKHMWDTHRISPVSGKEMSYIEYKEEIEFTMDDYVVIDTHIPSRWFASVWDLSSIKFIRMWSVPYLKIPSAHLTNHELINAALQTQVPIILSTGMSTEVEISEAVDLIPLKYPSFVLACTATYPCPDEEVHLHKIHLLNRNIMLEKWSQLDSERGHPDSFKWVPQIGFSSHSTSPYPAIYSAYYGAKMIEVHVTLDRAMPGSDHSASLELPAVELLIRELSRMPVLFGPEEFTVFPGELSKRKSLRGV